MISAGPGRPASPGQTSTARWRAAVVVLLMMTSASLSAVLSEPGPSQAAQAPVHLVAVDTPGVTVFPGFSPGIERYAVRPTASTAGVLRVRATTSDAAGSIRVDGRLVDDGLATLTGLVPGDEISVFIRDSAGTATYALVYLPADFPLLARATPPTAATEDGHVLLTLGKWTEPSRFFEVAVDDNGVPAVLRVQDSAMDFKLQPNGHFSTSVGATNDSAVVEYDEQWRVVGRHRTVGLNNTDDHDSILLPDGSRS